MPSLPSGRHIALDPGRLDLLAKDAFDAYRVVDLMSIDCIEHIYAYMELVEVFETITPGQGAELHEDSAPAKSPLVTSDNRMVVSELVNVTDEWTEEDLEAIASFLLSERTQLYFSQWLDDVRIWQKQLCNSENSNIKIQALWCVNGVHPGQTGEMI